MSDTSRTCTDSASGQIKLVGSGWFQYSKTEQNGKFYSRRTNSAAPHHLQLIKNPLPPTGGVAHHGIFLWSLCTPLVSWCHSWS